MPSPPPRPFSGEIVSFLLHYAWGFKWPADNLCGLLPSVSPGPENTDVASPGHGHPGLLCPMEIGQALAGFLLIRRLSHNHMAYL